MASPALMRFGLPAPGKDDDVDSTRFDDFTRQVATGIPRRQVLKGMVALVVGSLLSQVVARRNVYAAAGQDHELFLPLAARVCSEGSQCGVRPACGDFPGCICIEAAEGDIRCGKIPGTCDMPLCETSADCAQLGPGYFCDVPNSGCCVDPPATLARCIAPCDGSCPPAQRCGVGCCAVGDVCVDDRCVSPDDCALESVTPESMRGGLAALAAGAETVNVSPQGCIQMHQRFTNGEVVGKTFTIAGEKVSEWIRTHKQWAGYRDADLDGFYEWRSVIVDGATADESRTSEQVYDPATKKLRRRSTLDATAAGVRVKIEEADAAGVMVVVAEYDAPLDEEVALSEEELAATAGSAPAATCEANPCDPEQIKKRMEEGAEMALQCLANFGDRGVAIFEAAFNTLARQMTVRCAAIAGEPYATIGGWNNPQGTLRVTVDPNKYCGLSEGQRASLMFHEILHPALLHSHDPEVSKLPVNQRSQLDRIYGCIAMCSATSASQASRCQCAQCFATVTCDPICAPFNADCGAICKCGDNEDKYFLQCSECLAACPSGLGCFGTQTCQPVGQSPICPPVTCP